MSKVWLDGKLVDQDQAKVSVFDHGVLYGDGCFEGIRAYNGRVFKLRSHLKRMYESAERIRLTPPYTKPEIEKAIRETIAGNGLSDAYIRLVFTRGVGTLGLHPFRCPQATAFIIADKIELYPQELYDTGLKVIVAKRRRIPIESLDLVRRQRGPDRTACAEPAAPGRPRERYGLVVNEHPDQIEVVPRPLRDHRDLAPVVRRGPVGVELKDKPFAGGGDWVEPR